VRGPGIASPGSFDICLDVFMSHVDLETLVDIEKMAVDVL
jgi:hypothetical protein